MVWRVSLRHVSSHTRAICLSNRRMYQKDQSRRILSDDCFVTIQCSGYVPLHRSPLRRSVFSFLCETEHCVTEDGHAVTPYNVQGFWKTVGPSCHCIGVLSDAVSSVSQTAIFNNPQRRALRARSGHAVAHNRLAHRVLEETSLTAWSGSLIFIRNKPLPLFPS